MNDKEHSSEVIGQEMLKHDRELEAGRSAERPYESVMEAARKALGNGKDERSAFFPLRPWTVAGPTDIAAKHDEYLYPITEESEDY